MQLRARSGFTLVELLLALVVINAGLLALVGTTTVLVRRQTELHARSSASELAANRLQTLAASPCGARSDSTSIAGFEEYWSESGARNGFRELRDSVAYAAFGAAHSLTLTTRVVC